MTNAEQISQLARLHESRPEIAELAIRCIAENISVDSFRQQAMGLLRGEPINTPPIVELNQSRALPVGRLQTRNYVQNGFRGGYVGMSPEDASKFSILRAINHFCEHKTFQGTFEGEVSSQMGRNIKRQAEGLFIPMEVLKRDLSVGTATAGGHTVATNLLAGSFIDVLRNSTLVAKMGAKMLMGLQDNIDIPRKTTSTVAYWLSETGDVSQSDLGFDQVQLRPKRLAAFSVMTKQLMVQSSLDAESLVRTDLAQAIAIEIDRVAINGSGTSSQPLGILGTSGIGSVPIGTNGGAPTYDHLVDLESEVALDNADVGTLGYLTTSSIRGKLKKTKVDAGSGQFVWTKGEDGMGEINGYRAGATNQVPGNLTKGTSNGNCHAIIFGNWADLLIGFWGGVDLVVDPFTLATTGRVRVIINQFVDIKLRHAESFAAIKDATL